MIYWFLWMVFFFFKQKTAYEMRISDWSSDVCSSDLAGFGSKAIGLGAMQLLTEPILRLIANHFGGLESVGIVDFASRLCQIPRTFVGAIGQTMVPAFARATHASAIQQRRQIGRAHV